MLTLIADNAPATEAKQDIIIKQNSDIIKNQEKLDKILTHVEKLVEAHSKESREAHKDLKRGRDETAAEHKERMEGEPEHKKKKGWFGKRKHHEKKD